LTSGYIITNYLQHNKNITTRNNFILTIDKDNEDSTYGNLEFIITYLSIIPNENIFYNKMMKIYEFLDYFIKKLNFVDDFEIIQSKFRYKFNIYKYKNNELYFISNVPTY
jgi:hypothetical protein